MNIRVLFLITFLLLHLTGKTQISLPFLKGKEVKNVCENDYTIGANQYIIVSKILENIGADGIAILAHARRYMTESYKETKYTIILDDNRKRTITGKGRYENFITMNIFPNTYYLCADFYLKVDTQNGRARISLYAREYGGKRVNGNIVEEITDRIANFHPINKENTSLKKLYAKAFPELIRRMQATLAEMEKAVKDDISAQVEETDW